MNSGPSGGRSATPSVSVQRAALHRLFLTLFLRGRSNRGFSSTRKPGSVLAKLWLTLFFYVVMGTYALVFQHGTILNLSVCMHGLTFILLGTFILGACGEVLFNKDEADILLHRPVSPRSLLWAKVHVLVQISLWLAVAINLVSFWVALGCSDGSWRFLPVHALSILLESLFCSGCMVMAYLLFLRWFGRERFQGIMSMTQIIAIFAVVSLRPLTRTSMIATGGHGDLLGSTHWLILMPPMWFAGFDDALSGSGTGNSWYFALISLVATVGVLAAAFGSLSKDYGHGLQILTESPATTRPVRVRRRMIEVLCDLPLMRWWLRDPVERATFLLSAAYLVRDRDVRLRTLIRTGSILALPLILAWQSPGKGHEEAFRLAFAACFLAEIPMIILFQIRYSQQWQACDVFRLAPTHGPAPFCNGARKAVLCLFCAPALAAFLALASWLHPWRSLPMILPGLLMMPLYARLPGSRCVPLAKPSEEARSVKGALWIYALLLSSMALAGVAIVCQITGFLWWFIAFEAVIVISLSVLLGQSLAHARWTPTD